MKVKTSVNTYINISNSEAELFKENVVASRSITDQGVETYQGNGMRQQLVPVDFKTEAFYTGKCRNLAERSFTAVAREGYIIIPYEHNKAGMNYILLPAPKEAV